jgi:murein DD-endopeptidase MepM/ murein hydrolase activator NlpD
MKSKNVIAYIKRKQFYIALFTCCVTVFLIAILVWVRPKEDNKEIASLNGDMVNNEEENNKLITNLVENDDLSNEQENVNADEDYTNEEDVVEASTTIKPITINTEKVIGEGDCEDKVVEEASTIKPQKMVLEIAPVVKPNITFDPKEKMLWPVKGDILIPYSMDVPVHFKTLNHYKVNPAIYIASDVGQEVLVATEGIVESIKTVPETGVTVTIYHGNGYKSIYGQLNKKLSVKEGDLVKKGQVLGHIDKPSKYHVLLNSHLYFKVTNNEEAINPSELIE